MRLAAALVAALALGGCSGSAKPSSAANDIVLRTTRLAGYPSAEVGADGKTAVLSLTLPSALSAADVELGWQSGVAMLVVAYPRARSYRVGLRTQDRTLLVVTVDGKAARRAVGTDAPAPLRSGARFEIPGDGSEIVPQQSETTVGREAVLDADNRAASLASTLGPTVAGSAALTIAWQRAFTRAPGVPAPSGTQDAAFVAAERISRALARRKPDGAKEFETLVSSLVSENEVTALRAYAAAVEAATAAEPLVGGVLALTAEAAREVAEATPARSEKRAVTSLERAASLDTSASVEGTSFPSEVLARFGTRQASGVGLVWRGQGDAESGEPHVTASERWLAFRAADGTVYWLAGEGGDVALTDSSLIGWLYRTSSASLVDARDVARVVATFPPRGDR